MIKFRAIIFWAATAALVGLLALTIYGAFLGADRAKVLFNSRPLQIFWILLAVLLALGIVLLPGWYRRPAIVMMHLGMLLILAGSFLGTPRGHDLACRYFNGNPWLHGYMTIEENTAVNKVLAGPGYHRQLPFGVFLEDFQLEYYQPGRLYVQSEGRVLSAPAQPGQTLILPDGAVITILQVFDNLKVRLSAQGRLLLEDPKPGFNYALEVEYQPLDGSADKRIVFKRELAAIHDGGELSMFYQRDIKDYISVVRIFAGERQWGSFAIEVNKPLVFMGYHFFQTGYDEDMGRYTVLTVKSASGLNLVYAGLLLVTAATFWHFYGNRLGRNKFYAH